MVDVPMVDAIGFDLDGTLFDDREYVRHGLNAVTEYLECTYDVDVGNTLFTAYFDRGIRRRTFDVVLEEQGMSTDLVPELVDVYHAADGSLSPHPEVRATLADLAESSRLGVLTGGQNGRSKLDRLGLTDCFDVVLCTPEMGVSKREPEPFEMLLDRLGTDPTETMYVGDRPELDLVQPNALGMYTVHYVGSYRSNRSFTPASTPDYTIETMGALPNVVAKLDQ